MCCSVSVSLRADEPHYCLHLRSKVCRMHRNILECCQSHVCLVDLASLVLGLTDLTSLDRPIDLVPLVTKVYQCWKRIMRTTYVYHGLLELIAFYFSLIKADFQKYRRHFKIQGARMVT